VLEPFSHKYGHLWVVVFGGSNLAWALVMSASLVLLLAGYVLLSKGWRLVHGKKDRLVTNGVYAYARHPQYTGLFLVILAFLVQWPTLLTVLMAPVLIGAYVNLAHRGEVAMRVQFDGQYDEYARNVAAFLPPLSHWARFFTAPSQQIASGP
jgi:protein-S-isoprenylcysteine O-methyltransferase Ste14